MKDRQINFGPYRLDETNECLWCGEEAVSVRPKVFAVLKYLVARSGELVTKQQLLEGVWPDTFVGDAVLKDSIRQLREALGDEVKSPQFIQTVHRRGYRFIAPVTEVISEIPQGARPEPAFGVPRFSSYQHSASPNPAPPNLLGREDVLSQLLNCLEIALTTHSQVMFVTGEAGIGKTTLVEAFLEQVPALHNVWIARGQCLEQYGAGEPYLPVLEALSRLVQEQPSGPIIDLLSCHAPSWLAQMPWLMAFSDQGLSPPLTLAAEVTRERMLREMAEAIDIFTAERPLVLVLEDLHWSDYSTLDLVSYLASRRNSARFMLVGTYRPVEVILRDHPLKGVKQELQLHKQCSELALDYLTREIVAQFLDLKFPGHRFPETLAAMIHQRTEGNPLFMINVAEYLVSEKIIAENDGVWQLQVELDEVELDVPENIRNLIEKHIERLSPEDQRVLEGASVVGMDCSAIAISAGLAEDVLRIEEVCDGLARSHHFLLPAYLATLPDGTLTPRYRFIHALYLDVLYKRVAPTRRSQIHGRIGVRGEAIYGDRVGEIAAELAVHFEQARDAVRGVKYLQMAAENAARRSAHHEAKALARRALELIQTLSATPERSQQQLTLENLLSQSRTALKKSSPEITDS
jgi:predicted ATPase/DNA-binding winged helix-turn-helix (wHTH) protein